MIIVLMELSKEIYPVHVLVIVVWRYQADQAETSAQAEISVMQTFAVF
jgi:hypothetical protein